MCIFSCSKCDIACIIHLAKQIVNPLLLQVSRVFYPGLQSHPDHLVAKKLLSKGYSGMMSFQLKGKLEDGIKFVEVSRYYVVFFSVHVVMTPQSLKVIVHAVSLGGVESLVCHPASTTHNDVYVSAEDKKIAGITDDLIRLR